MDCHSYDIGFALAGTDRKNRFTTRKPSPEFTLTTLAAFSAYGCDYLRTIQNELEKLQSYRHAPIHPDPFFDLLTSSHAHAIDRIKLVADCMCTMSCLQRLRPSYRNVLVVQDGSTIIQQTLHVLIVRVTMCDCRPPTPLQNCKNKTFRAIAESIAWLLPPDWYPTYEQMGTHHLHSPYAISRIIFCLQVLADTSGPRDALRHTQSSSCCAHSWTLSVIDRRRSSVDC